ncbi:hypothetical protein GCM10028803_24340 [Larkinella knui]|uniref:Uncharacterized protein n=1 Tax=Larkinella knui TaxID=2025310 RepID=A0A3P1CVS5_9BACT|nr:hypothetical protein [Larkinella knui]RRB17497.1 hypothetical protein EHT87_04200 [Larkinella knui]
MIHRLLVSVLLLFFVHSVEAQSDTLSVDSLMIKQKSPYAAMIRPGQKYLALDVMGRLGGFRRYRYFPNEEIKFRYNGKKYREPLYGVTDTTLMLILEDPNTFLPETVHFRIDKIQKVYVNRQIPFITQGTYIFPIAGTLFFLADVINVSRSEKRLVADSRALKAPAVMIALGAICYKVSYPRYRINKNHRLKVLETY